MAAKTYSAFDREGRSIRMTVPADEFVIHCRVSGGVTGTREALLKSNGAVRYFTSREEAQAEADRLMATMNHRFSTANFAYWVEEA